MDLLIRIMLEVIGQGQGALDTRAIDLKLGFKGVNVEHGILTDLRELESQGLIEKVAGPSGGTGPRWGLTAAGVEWLAAADVDEFDS
jgi:hypothetical protein